MSQTTQQKSIDSGLDYTQEPLEEAGVLASLGLNGQQFASQVLNFAIVLAVLWFLILKPLTKKLDERRKIIDESLDNAQKIETNLMMSTQKFDELIDRAQHDANDIMEKAHEMSKKMSADMKEKTTQEIAVLIEKAKSAISAEKEEMRTQLHKETVELVILATEKILGQKLDDTKDQKFILDILKSLD